MKWLLALLAVLFMVAPAMAGEDPYISVVGQDNLANTWYVSAKYFQFMYNENDTASFAIPVSFGTTFPARNQYTRVGSPGTEMYRSQTANNQAEVCDTTAAAHNPNSKTPAGNAGFYEWYINIPKKPSGEINIVIQCGVLKPNALAFYPNGMAIELCAAETGERIGNGLCVREEVEPGVSPVNQLALPKITAIAYPGAYNVAFTPFNLTAFKNPSTYALNFDGSGAIQNGTANQILDGSVNARILLKACMDKTVVTKLPVTGQVNALGQTETDLEPGDMIYVRMDVPRQNSVDIYCHSQSARVMGIGETWN
jgi:hypothetical protein